MNVQSLFRTKPIQQLLSEAARDSAAGFSSSHTGGHSLAKTLGVWDLTAFGIAAVIGAGIFSTIGNAAYAGGPGVVFLFLFTAIACAFSAFCYAEFAATLPISGSAYSYAYATMGEFIAWIIGWDLLMEYAIGNIAVAISWSDYFTSLLSGYGFHIPSYLTMDFLTANRAYGAVQAVLDAGTPLAQAHQAGVSMLQLEGYDAWMKAPRLLGLPIVCDVPAMFVTVLVTWIVYVGIQESKRVSNFMVLVKIAVLLMVVSVGAFYVKPENWQPFAPNGVTGILKGVSAVFFAYIGFDAISTTAEECKDPQRDLPKAMIYSLIICTILYILVALVLTGVVNYKMLEVGDPLAYVFGPEGANVTWIAGVISVSAVIALFTVLLVFQLGQPRIWMAMSRDGLLPSIFASIHPKFKTPWFSTIVTGLLVAVPSLFMNLTEVTDLTSIGTLFAFMIVCMGILRLDPNRPREPGKFRTPYINGRFIFPALVFGTIGYCFIFNPEMVRLFFSEYSIHQFPITFYALGMIVLSYYAFTRHLSLIPLLGFSSCGYLITELGITNWTRFGIWLIVGLVIYFLYGAKNSKLGKRIEGSRF